MMKENSKKKETIRRLKIIEGHLKKVRQMVETGEYCIDVVQQSLAVQNALKKVDEIVLDSHLHTCVIEAIGEKSAKGGSASGGKQEKIEEILELFKKKK